MTDLPASPDLVDPPLHSPDGRMTLQHNQVRIFDQTFGLLELEGAELKPVRWLLWYLLGGLLLAFVAIAYLSFWLRTGPAMLGLTVGALLFLLGRRGTNRLRLVRLGREALYFSLPGAAPDWYPLIGALNRRIRARHDEAALAAAAALAALEEAAAPPPPADLPDAAAPEGS